MSKTILYFAYGANRDPRMIAAILGKSEADLSGTLAILEGYDIAVQRLDQVPDTISPKAPVNVSPRQLLKENWDEDFTSYVISPNPEGRVSGVIWELSPDERERVRDWELLDYGWYEDCEGRAIVDGREVSIVTERLGEGQSVDHMVDGIGYETWLHDPARFEMIAGKVRREYDERMKNPEGISSQPEINKT